MKLIQIFALATVMATAAVAQSTTQGSNGGQQSKPSPTPQAPAKATPAQTKSGTGAAAPHATAGSAKKSPTTRAAKAKTLPVKSNPSAAGKGPAAAKATTTDKKPAVQTGVLQQKKKTGAQKNPGPTTPAMATGTKAGAQAAPAAGANTASSKKSAGPTAAGAASKPGTAAAGAVKGKTPAKPATAAAPPTTKRKKTAAKAAAAPPAAKATAPAPPPVAQKKPVPRLIGSAGRRDPFVSPIRNAGAVSPSQSCTSGKRCLNIPELVLQGTVRDISGKMMAVVSTANRTRTYTLRENDQVFNGSVEKITSDSVIFREYVKDALGRESAKEVVKKMGPPS